MSPPKLDSALYTPISQCWICTDPKFQPAFTAQFNLAGLLQDPRLEPVLRPYHGQQIDLNRCVGCGFIQPSALPADTRYFETIYDLAWSEDWIAGEFENTYKDEIFHGILADLARRLPASRRRLLDIGCHVGRMPFLAQQAGWQAEGIELNPKTAAFAAQRTGLPIHRLNAKELAATGRRYDAITLTDVLEHIPEPRAIVKDLFHLLEPGGVIAIKVPCGPAQYRKQRLKQLLRPGSSLDVAENLVHVNHFSPRSLRKVLELTGYVDISVQAARPEYFPGANLKRRLDRFVRRMTYTAGRVLPFGVHTPLSFNLQAFAHTPTA